MGTLSELNTINRQYLERQKEITAMRIQTELKKYSTKGKAHTVQRSHMVNKQDWAHGVFYGSTVMYRSYLHYAPECGYYGCIKDNHGNLIFNTQAYCLASTVRELIGEFIYQTNKGWER